MRGNEIKDNAGSRRVVVDRVMPEIDRGRFPIKRACGEPVVVEADVFADGHDALTVRLCYRHEQAGTWTELPMELVGNDRWRASFPTARPGRYRYTVTGWINHFATWRRNLSKKAEAGQPVAMELLMGAELIRKAIVLAGDDDAARLRQCVTDLKAPNGKESERVRLALGEELRILMESYPDRSGAVSYDHELELIVDAVKARFSAWYELFPRSCSRIP
ncbi:MAG TPA: maltotransferase domain-containing protein, partial [Nitrospira sp.]